MKRAVSMILCLVAGVTMFPSTSPAPLVWRQGEGWVYEGSDAEDIQLAKTAEGQFKIAQDYEAAGDLGRALAAYRVIVRKYSQTLEAPRAQFKVAYLLEQAGDFQAAFKNYEALIAKYPRSNDFDAAVESMYKIGQLYLDGEKVRLMGIPLFTSLTRATKMFEAIIKAAPFGKYAPLSQFNIGLCYERQGNVEKALDAYISVIEKYPLHDIADDAAYQIGYVWLMEGKKGSYDMNAYNKAREAFEDFVFRFPNSDKVPQAEENLKALGGDITRSSYEIAQFYERRRDYRAAIVYYNRVLQEAPSSDESTKALDRIAVLEAKIDKREGVDLIAPLPESMELTTPPTVRPAATPQPPPLKKAVVAEAPASEPAPSVKKAVPAPVVTPKVLKAVPTPTPPLKKATPIDPATIPGA